MNHEEMLKMITPNYIKCPCKQCLPPKRHEKCHSDCKDYIEYKRILNLETDKIKKKLILREQLMIYV